MEGCPNSQTFDLFGANNVEAGVSIASVGGVNVIKDILSVDVYQFTHIIEKIADARAENGPNRTAYKSLMTFKLLI